MNIRSFAVAAVAALATGFAAADSFKPNEDGEKKIAKVELKRGASHTFILSGIDAENSAITSWDVYGTYGDDDDIYVFDSAEVEENGKLTWYLALSAEDWPDDAPSKVTFQVWLYGWEYDKSDDPQPDRSYKFSHQDGYYLPDGGGSSDPVPVVPVGTAERPGALSVSGTPASPTAANYTAPEMGKYYFNAALTEGRKYCFGVLGGSASIAYSLGGGDLFADEKLARAYTNKLEWSDCDWAYVFVPSASATYSFVVDAPDGKFTLKTALVPARAPDKHDIAATLADGVAAQVQPGHLHDPASGFYDAVIDGSLCAFYPEKGASYVFETTGADSDLMMRLYAKDGTTVAEGLYVKSYDQNCRVAFAAPSDSNFTKYSPVYVGVCQRFEHKTLAEEDAEVITAGKVSLTARKVQTDASKTPLCAVQGDREVSPALTDGARPAVDQELSSGAWVNTYTIAARSGVTYALKAVSEDDSGLVLGASVYTLNAQKKPVPVDSYGSIDPAADGWLTFTMTANAQVYVDVAVEDGAWGGGAGLDYGPYDLYATGWKTGASLSPLTVTLLGAPEDDMTWQIDKENSVQYLSGTTALLPAGTYSITPAKVKNYAVPSAASVKVPNEGGYVYKYTDTADPLDDWPNDKATLPGTSTKYKPTSISPSAKGVSVSRSLWGDGQNLDKADWFTFKASAGVCYRFVLSETTGAPRISVFDWNLANGWDVSKNAVENFAEGDDGVFQFAVGAEGKGKTYYLRVAHADEANPVDSSYTLTATSANVGSIKFAKSSISVKEDAAFAEVAVNRTAKEGRVRVRYRTAEGTAKPGERYYPASGELVWEDGDGKAKNIQVRLIPDETPTYVDGQPVAFSVVLETVEKSELAEGEYLPTIDGGSTATVSIAETAKKTPGTIQAVCSAPKKPVFSVTAGDELCIPVERLAGAGGANGAVGVSVEGSSKGVDFTLSPRQLVWGNGETDVKTIALAPRFAASDYTASKQITLKLSALSGAQYEKPSLASSSITVNVLNDKFEDSMANYSKTVTAAKDGYTVKEGKAGTWVVMYDGSFYAPLRGDLSFSFSTTGTFRYTVDGVERTFTATAKDKTLKISGASTFSVVGYELDGESVALRQGVKYEASFGTAGTLKATNLPAGLKLAQDKATKEWILSGTPTKPGVYQATVGASSFCYKVAAAGTSIGTFNGLVYSAGPTNGIARVASIAFTSAAGKLSAKVSVGGKSYTFADTGYSYAEEGDDAVILHATLAQAQKAGGETYTNYLHCSVWDSDEGDKCAWTLANEVVLEMNCLPDAKGNGFQEGIVYDTGRLYRDNSKVAAWVAEAAKYAGYYTLALAPASATEGEPLGNGYLTATVDAKGKAKLAGMLADGTSVSASSVVYLSDDALVVPVYLAKGTSLFAGLVALSKDGSGDIVAEPYAADVPLRWFNDDPNSTEWGDAGFAVDVEAVGGWYNTVFNLQRHYLGYDFVVETAAAGDLPSELLPAGCSFVAGIGPDGMALGVAGNAISADKQVLVKDASKKYNDWQASVNPQNVQVKFTRATGLVSGSFSLWYEGYGANGALEQKSLSNVKHQGVMVLSRAEGSFLPDEVLTAGFFTLDVPFGKRKWKASYPFNIRLEYTGGDFTE